MIKLKVFWGNCKLAIFCIGGVVALSGMITILQSLSQVREDQRRAREDQRRQENSINTLFTMVISRNDDIAMSALISIDSNYRNLKEFALRHCNKGEPTDG